MNTYRELTGILVIPSFSKAVCEMSKDHIKELFGNEAAAMYGFEQNNPYHCYDLLMHSARTVDGIGKRGVSDDEFAMLRAAAFYHDIGKPDTAFWNEKKQRQSFYGHAARSAEIAGKVFKSINMPEQLMEQACFMITHHDDLTNIHEVTPESVEALIKRYREKNTYIPSNRDIHLLLELCEADICAQRDVVWENGKIISTREDRLDVVRSVREMLS